MDDLNLDPVGIGLLDLGCPYCADKLRGSNRDAFYEAHKFAACKGRDDTAAIHREHFGTTDLPWRPMCTLCPKAK